MTEPGTYTVQPGDTLSRIAAKLGLDWHDLATWNGIAAPYTIHPGDVLRTVPPVSDPLMSIREAVAAISTEQVKLSARVKALEDARPPAPAPTPPAPTPQKTLWGVAASNTADHATGAKLFAPVQAWRYYQQPGEPIAWPKEYTLGPGEVLVYSDKVSPQDKIAGKADAALTALFKAAPTDRPFLYCPWHEPENDPFTPAQFVAAFQHVAPLARKVGPHILMTVIYMDWTFNPRSGRNWRDWWPGDDAVDVFGVDAYRWAPGNPPVGNDHLFDVYVSAAKSMDKPWALLETGVDKATYPDPAKRLQAVTEVAQAAASAAPMVVTYFNYSMTHDWRLSAAEASAWKAASTA